MTLACPTDTPLVCTLDDRYVQPLMVMWQSLAARPEHHGLRVAVVHHGLSGASRVRLRRHADRLGLDVTFHYADQAHAGPVSGWVTDAVYLRLSLGDVLADAPRVLYVDVDTLVLGDLSPLLETDLGGRLLGAVRDAQNPVIGKGIAFPAWAELGLPQGRDYFNSGLMLIDLDACRAANVFAAARAFLANHPDQVRLWDQDALNVAVADRWHRLDRRWNTFALSPLAQAPDYTHEDAEPHEPLARLLAAEPDASILHFAGPAKPWRTSYPESPIKDRYRAFLRAVVEAESRALR